MAAFSSEHVEAHDLDLKHPLMKPLSAACQTIINNNLWSEFVDFYKKELWCGCDPGLPHTWRTHP